jgi:hypothetical protein
MSPSSREKNDEEKAEGEKPTFHLTNSHFRINPLPFGYRDVAFRMVEKGSEFAIFRRFGQLNMLNLLSLQAELVYLQNQFREWCEQCENGTMTPESKSFSYSFEKMRVPYDKLKKLRAENPSDEARKFRMLQLEAESEQYSILLEIRAKLKEYSR